MKKNNKPIKISVAIVDRPHPRWKDISHTLVALDHLPGIKITHGVTEVKKDLIEKNDSSRGGALKETALLCLLRLLLDVEVGHLRLHDSTEDHHLLRDIHHADSKDRVPVLVLVREGSNNVILCHLLVLLFLIPAPLHQKMREMNRTHHRVGEGGDLLLNLAQKKKKQMIVERFHL